jgi:hypothetical protein
MGTSGNAKVSLCNCSNSSSTSSSSSFVTLIANKVDTSYHQHKNFALVCNGRNLVFLHRCSESIIEKLNSGKMFVTAPALGICHSEGDEGVL